MKIRKHPIDHFEGIARIDENAGPSAARLQYSIFKFAAYRFQSPTGSLSQPQKHGVHSF